MSDIKQRDVTGLPPSAYGVIPADKVESRGWSLYIDGVLHVGARLVELVNEKFGRVTYGKNPLGFDGWSFSELGGGGAVTVPYTILDERLYIGVVFEDRPLTGRKLLNLPRGFIDPGESYLEAAEREFQEEAGVDSRQVASRLLDGLPTTFNSAFNDTTGLNVDGSMRGARYYGIEIPAALVERTTEGVVIKSGALRIREGRETTKIGTQITGGLRFIPYKEAIASLDSHTVIGAARLHAMLY